MAASLSPLAPAFIPQSLAILPYMKPISDSEDNPVFIPNIPHYSPYDSIPRSPYCPIFNCCQDCYQASNMSIYHNSTFVYNTTVPSPLELEPAICTPQLLPPPLHAAPHVQHKRKGRESKITIFSQHKKEVQQKLLWVAKREGSSGSTKCPSPRRAPAEPSLKFEQGKTTVMIKNIPNKYT